VKKKMETCTDKLVYNVLNKRQNALKISANSMFGFLGVREGGKLPLIQGAMAITWRGRSDIGMVNSYLIEKMGAKIVYNDTDSVMVDCGIQDPKDCAVIGEKLAEEITKLFPPPCRIEFEKAMRILCLKKKKYAALLIDKDGTHITKESKILKRGIVTARRDNCKWMRTVYDKCLINILERKPLRSTINIIIDAVLSLFHDQVDPKDLVIIRELNSAYKSENFFMKIFQDELRKRDKTVSGGDRLQYIIIHKPGEEMLGKRMVLYEEYMDSVGGNERYYPDNVHYLDLLKNPIEQLVTIAYPEDFSEMYWKYYQPSGRRKRIQLDNFIKILCDIIGKGGKDIDAVTKELTDFMFKKDRVVIRNRIIE
jgi:DNA polymerase delta subunit 1